MADQTPAVAARRIVRSLAARGDSFRTGDVLDHPDAPARRTVQRALSSLCEDGVIVKEGRGVYRRAPDADLGEGEYGDRHQFGPLSILHCFADWGCESEVLSGFGTVHRVGLETRDTGFSEPFDLDAARLLDDPPEEIAETAPYDIGLFHPPCTRFSDLVSISGDAEDHDDLIPLAREIGEELCEDWVVENKPKGLGVTRGHDGVTRKVNGNNVVVLTGKQFQLPVQFARAFETTFALDAPPTVAEPRDTEVSTYFSADRSTEWWAATKGYSCNYAKEPLVKSAVPAPYVRWLLRQYLRARSETDGRPARSKPEDPHPAEATAD